MEEGTFSRWLKKDGELVNEGDAIYELESDKATQEVESFDSGELRILPDAPGPGDTVKVGQLLGYLCDRNETSPTVEVAIGCGTPTTPTDSLIPGASDAISVESESVQVFKKDADIPQSSINGYLRQASGVECSTQLKVEATTSTHSSSDDVPPTQYIRVSPRAARRAIQAGVDLRMVQGSGRHGRIREKDVVTAQQQTGVESIQSELPNPPPITNRSETATTSALRQAIASRMLAAVQQTAQVTLTGQADATALVGIREQLKSSTTEQSPPVPSITDFFIKLSAVALERHPTLVHQWTELGMFVPDSLDIAVAVNTSHGLYAPVIRDVPSLSLFQIADRLRDIAARARNRQISSEELKGGVFTVTNLGNYRVDAFTPILNMPQTAILGVGRIANAPAVVGDLLTIRKMVTISLTFDHRVVDGASAAELLTTICELVERPVQWLMPYVTDRGTS